MQDFTPDPDPVISRMMAELGGGFGPKGTTQQNPLNKPVDSTLCYLYIAVIAGPGISTGPFGELQTNLIL